MTTPQEQAEKAATTVLATITAELDAIDGWAVDSAEDSEFAAEMLRDVKARHKALEDKRKTITKPLNAALRAVNDLFRPPRDLLERAEALLKDKIAGYLEAQAAANEVAIAAVAAAETAEQAGEALALVRPVAATPAGVSVRYRYRAVVCDAALVPVDFRMPDAAKIQAYTDEAVKLRGAPTPIPGVRFERESIVASRAVKS